MRKHITYSLLAVAFCTSCSGFLEDHSQTKEYARTCEDLQELIIGNGYFDLPANKLPPMTPGGGFMNVSTSEFYMPWLHVVADECEEACFNAEDLMKLDYSKDFFGMYTWAKDPFVTADGLSLPNSDWNKFYKHIAIANTVLDKADNFTQEPEQTRNNVKGQAYFIRAINYFFLINVYALPYSSASASSDPGVPLKITPEVEARDFERNSVQEVYDQIVSDLENAVECLHGIENPSMWYASEAAALTLLSRVYCYMGKWDKVSAICDKVIALNKYRLSDISNLRFQPGITFDFTKNFLDVNSPEVIFTQGQSGVDRSLLLVQVSYSSSPTPTNSKLHYFTVSQELMQLYTDRDMRLNSFFFILNYTSRLGRKEYNPIKFRSGKFLNPASTTGLISDVSVIRLAEVYLNKAEALAMTGKEPEAIAALEVLRKQRMETGYSAVRTANNTIPAGEELMSFIRDERARELCFEGHRWFDLRRYMVSPKYRSAKTLEHKHYKNKPLVASYAPGELIGTAVLKPLPADEGRWVMPIPESEIELNHGKLKNNLRGDVPLQK